MASNAPKIAAVVGLTFIALCMLVTPAFSAAGFLALLVGLPLALHLRDGDLPRSALLAATAGCAAALQMPLSQWIGSDAFIYIWGGVFVLAAAVLASYLIARRRDA